VVHSAAALPLYKAADIYSTEVEGTRVLLEAVTQHGVARFIFISSTAVYGIPDKCPIREDDATVGVGPYGEAKIEAEKICLSFREAGLCVPILRPKTFIGPERLGVFELLYDWAFEGRNFPVIGSGENLYQLLDVWDLCVAIVLCATREPNLVNDTFNVGAAEFGSMRDNFQAVLDRAGHGGKVIGFPAAPVIAMLKFAEYLHLSPLYQWIYETADHDSAVSIDRIRTKLQFQPRYSNEQAMVRNYDWYAEHRNDYRGLTGASHRIPWKRGILGLVKYFF
jgi:nucleoside-diphosphate-sugar epimerase